MNSVGGLFSQTDTFMYSSDFKLRRHQFFDDYEKAILDKLNYIDFAYDAKGRIIESYDRDSVNVSLYEYDANGNVVSIESLYGRQEFAYNQHNQLINDSTYDYIRGKILDSYSEYEYPDTKTMNYSTKKVYDRYAIATNGSPRILNYMWDNMRSPYTHLPVAMKVGMGENNSLSENAVSGSPSGYTYQYIYLYNQEGYPISGNNSNKTFRYIRK